MFAGDTLPNVQCSQNQARIQELVTPNCSTVYVLGPKALHEGKQTVVSVFCLVYAEFTYHDPDIISPYDENVSF